MPKGRKSVRLCSRCGYRHSAPTGKLCTAVLSETEMESNSEEETFHENNEGKQLDPTEEEAPAKKGVPKVRAMASRASVTALEERMSERFSRIEDMIAGLSNKSQKKTVPIFEDAPSIAGLTTTSDDSEAELSRAARRKHKSRKQFAQSKFMEEGETLTSFESVILLQARSLLYAVEHGLDPIGIIHHLKFLATKATAATYKPEAFIGYDERVRQRACREGISAFTDISHEDVLLHFCHENMVYREKSKKKSEASKKKSGQKYCTNFNDTECLYKNCIFIHRCMACEDPNHGRKSCPNIKKSK